MAAPLQGITGLTGFVNSVPELDAPGIHGHSANPDHARAFWEHPVIYPWESAIDGLDPHALPLSPYVSIDPDSNPEDQTMAAGQMGANPTGDHTPYRGHAAPTPRGLIFNRSHGPNHLPDGATNYLEQSAYVHGVNMNASAAHLYSPTLFAQQDEWNAFFEVERGQSILDPDIGAQAKSGLAPGGWGSRGREQSLARQNEYGFDSAHMHRRYATGHIPGNRMWMKPAGRPLHRVLPHTARPPVGVTSVFAGQNPRTAYQASSPWGGVLTQAPVEYQQPIAPYVAPQLPANDGTMPGTEGFF